MDFFKNLLDLLLSVVLEKFGAVKAVSGFRSKIDLLIKHSDFFDAEELGGHVRAHLFAEIYGKGRIIPKAYQHLAYDTFDPELVLSLYPKVWNFLSIKREHVILRPDLSTSMKRRFFQSAFSFIGPSIFLGSVCGFYFAVQHLASWSANFTELNRQTIDGVFLVATSCFGLVMGFVFTEVINSKLKALEDLIELAPNITLLSKNPS